MNIEKVQIKDQEVEITYSTSTDAQRTETVLKDASGPDPAFTECFRRFAYVAWDILGEKTTPSKSFFAKLEVKSVILKTDDTGNPGCVIVCTVPIDSSRRPLNFNTPVKYVLPFENDNPDDAPFYLSEVSAKLLDELKAHALDFIKGKRAQGDLFEQPAAPSLKEIVERASGDKNGNEKFADKKRSKNLVQHANAN